MRTFTDNAGRAYRVSIDGAAVKRIRQIAGVVVDPPGDNPPSGALDRFGAMMEHVAASPRRIGLVLLAIVQPDIAAAGMSEEEFARAMIDGEAIGRAGDVVCMAFIDLLPPDYRRGAMRAAGLASFITNDN